MCKSSVHFHPIWGGSTVVQFIPYDSVRPCDNKHIVTAKRYMILCTLLLSLPFQKHPFYLKYQVLMPKNHIMIEHLKLVFGFMPKMNIIHISKDVKE